MKRQRTQGIFRTRSTRGEARIKGPGRDLEEGSVQSGETSRGEGTWALWGETRGGGIGSDLK